MKQMIIAAFAAFAALMSADPAAAALVHFIPGTYQLSDSDGGAPIDTLDVMVSGGVATFALSGTDNETFSVPDASKPTDIAFFGGSLDVLYEIASTGITASWDTTTYGGMVFYGPGDSGGFCVFDLDTNALLYNFFQSDAGPAVVFFVTDTPEPVSLALFGAGLAGAAALRRRRRRI